MKLNSEGAYQALQKITSGVFEIRVLDGKTTYSGYFKDTDKAIKELEKLKGLEQPSVYFTLQQVKDDCYSRSQRDKLVKNATPTTSDVDISNYEWLFIDLDPKRASGVSSSNEELELAKKKAQEVYRLLKASNFSEPIVALSGNGYHLLYKVHIQNTKENAELVAKTVKAIKCVAGDDKIDIDQKTCNPARICKLYGTMATKGINTEERPHRESKIIYMPSEIKPVSKETLQGFANSIIQEPPQVEQYKRDKFNLQDFIAKNGIRVTETINTGDSTRYILENCLFNESHKGKDACLIELSNGAIVYKCFHNSCDNYKWQDVRKMFEPDAYTYRAKPNSAEDKFVPKKISELSKNIEQEKDVFLQISEIEERAKNEPEQEHIKTGITEIDRLTKGGLRKGEVSLISGLRGSGKSTFLYEIALNVVDNGYKVAIYSGELTPKNTARWILRQSAGYEGTFKAENGEYQVKQSAKGRIAKWLDGKMYIYNNDYGHNFLNLKKSLETCVAEKKVDFIVIDNLMMLGISDLAKEKYEQQSQLVGILCEFARANNVHIILVAHPRKSNGFLRLDDVSGSNDIINKAENAFVVHRVNNDFKRLSQEMFHWSSDDPLYQCNNVVEVCKGREDGMQDNFIPLWFDERTKRMMNTPKENKNYGWDVENAWRDKDCF